MIRYAFSEMRPASTRNIVCILSLIVMLHCQSSDGKIEEEEVGQPMNNFQPEYVDNSIETCLHAVIIVNIVNI